jgi:deferrochelatase/peroxidase EfeB
VTGDPNASEGNARAMDPQTVAPELQHRRTFLAGAGAAALAGLGAAACSPSDEAAAPTEEQQSSDQVAAVDTAPVSFRSSKQQGVLQTPVAAGVVAAFDIAVATKDELSETLQLLSGEIERIMTGAPAVDADNILPPPDSGLLEGTVGSAGTAITLAFGASFFDERFGLADRRPAELIPMPRFFNDRLVEPALSDGDLALVISSSSSQAVVYALQQVVRVTGRRLQLRWVQEGYNELLPPSAGSVAPTRNLMGFRDGTSNLDTTDEAEMDEHVWVQDTDAEPSWAVGGTYLAVRTIRMLIEFWSTAALVRQEQIFGRHRDSGAPLGQTEEGEEPSFAADQNDLTIPPQSHIRRGNPRTPETGRILRKGFSYLNGVDQTGTLDQGLLFLAFQRSLNRGFLAAQSRLDGEPLEDYIKPVGGGLFFVPPGPGDGNRWLGQDLLA